MHHLQDLLPKMPLLFLNARLHPLAANAAAAHQAVRRPRAGEPVARASHLQRDLGQEGRVLLQVCHHHAIDCLSEAPFFLQPELSAKLRFHEGRGQAATAAAERLRRLDCRRGNARGPGGKHGAKRAASHKNAPLRHMPLEKLIGGLQGIQRLNNNENMRVQGCFSSMQQHHALGLDPYPIT